MGMHTCIHRVFVCLRLVLFYDICFMNIMRCTYSTSLHIMYFIIRIVRGVISFMETIIISS